MSCCKIFLHGAQHDCLECGKCLKVSWREILMALCVVVLGIGVIFMIVSPIHTMGDMIAGTILTVIGGAGVAVLAIFVFIPRCCDRYRSLYNRQSYEDLDL